MPTELQIRVLAVCSIDVRRKEWHQIQLSSITQPARVATKSASY
jgi:hypothetical protein